MTSKIKENLLFYLASAKDKSRSIVIGHNLNLKSELVIKLLIKNCRFKPDLLLVDGLRSNYSNYEFNNIYSFCDLNSFDQPNFEFNQSINNLEKSIQSAYTDNCVIVDSINLLILNLNAIQLNKFVNHLLQKYSKTIILFNNEIIDSDYLFKIQEICSSYFELSTNTLYSNEIQVHYIYKKKCVKLSLDLLKGNYQFTFDTLTFISRLTESKSDDIKSTSDYTRDLSFDLAINESKKKEETVLPFMRAQNTSKVYYIPDKFDDVDEEDPDDDLLI